MAEGVVMVAVRDTEHTDELVKLACRLAKGTGAKVFALSVAEIAPALPLDADSDILDKESRSALDRAVEVSQGAYGIAIETRLVRARSAGPTVVEEAQENKAALLVIGYHHRTGLGGLLLGSCVHHVIAHAPCRVILSVDPAHKDAQ